MAPKDHRRNFSVFKGISQTPSVIELSEVIGGKLGLPMYREPTLNPNLISPMKKEFAKRGSYQLDQVQVLPSNTPLIQIRKDDVRQLAIDNSR